MDLNVPKIPAHRKAPRDGPNVIKLSKSHLPIKQSLSFTKKGGLFLFYQILCKPA